MDDYSGLHADIERHMRDLLGQLGQRFTNEETAEVEEFLNVGEFGLALETLAAVLIDDDQDIDITLLKHIETIAGSMRLGDAPFMRDLHNFHERTMHEI